MTFLTESLTQLEFSIPSELAENCWQQSQAQPTAKGLWNEYLNRICLQLFLTWLQSEYAPQANLAIDERLLSSLWSVVNGTVLNWGKKRLVLIPDKSFDMNELEIPQEWVDIPKLVGDYYLAVQINPDDLSMVIWGYTTHKQIKELAIYNSITRTYNLDAMDMVADLQVLWVVNQLNPDEDNRIAVTTLEAISPIQSENLLSRLANPNIFQPRLELPFSVWGELVSNDDWRQRLYQLRQNQSHQNQLAYNQSSQDELANKNNLNQTINQTVTNLSQWIQNAFEDNWQSLDFWFGNRDLSFSFRNTEANPDGMIVRARIITLPHLNLPNTEALLVLSLDPEADDRTGIRIQLRSRTPEEYLPSQTNLKLLSSTGEIIQSVQSRSQDNIIQLKRFRSPAGTQFKIQIEVGDFIVTEDFLI